jgi:uncharacterized glyoxalase superfamily protein PhnB
VTRASHIPEGWPALIPRIFARDPERLVEFIVRVFDAQGSFRPDRPTELRFGDSMLMVSGTDERAATPAFLYVYVPDLEQTVRRALELGATSLEPPRDLPYGDRRAMVRDAWGNTWQIATHSGRFAHGASAG